MHGNTQMPVLLSAIRRKLRRIAPARGKLTKLLGNEWLFLWLS